MDTIVIGGGVAGLLTALRLALAGQEVTVVEADALGSGATIANHGMLHSGALYVGKHDHIVAACQEAQAAFTMLLGEEPVVSNEVVYVVAQDDVSSFRTSLGAYAIPHVVLHADTVPELPPEIAYSHALIGVRERVISSRLMVHALARQCLAAGVALLPGTVVHRIAGEDGRVTGAVIGAGEHLAASCTVLAAGIGTPRLLSGLGSRHSTELKSRLDMMVHFPRARLRRGVVFTAIDQPVTMPAPGGGALVSFFGGRQPQIAGRRGFAVELGKASLLVSETMRAVSSGIIDPTGGTAYVTGKTDYVGAPHTENSVVNPGFHVIDHADEGLGGLHTVITGKMTLAFHASRAVASALLSTGDVSLNIPPICEAIPLVGMQTVPVAIEPWAEPGAI